MLNNIYQKTSPESNKSNLHSLVGLRIITQRLYHIFITHINISFIFFRRGKKDVNNFEKVKGKDHRRMLSSEKSSSNNYSDVVPFTARMILTQQRNRDFE